MNNFDVRKNEMLESLGDGYYIIQPLGGYRFGSDAIALKNFAGEYIKRGERVFDLCSGCGIVGIELAIERGASVFGAELDNDLCTMSNRSAAGNGLENATFYNADIRNADALTGIVGKKSFDAVVCNPPFFKPDSRPASVAPTANCELTVGFGHVVDAAKELLKVGGGFYIVHTASRLDEIVCSSRARGLTPKNLIVNGNGKTFLLRCVVGGKDGLTVSVEKF